MTVSHTLIYLTVETSGLNTHIYTQITSFMLHNIPLQFRIMEKVFIF